MEELLSLLGTLFFMFLILAAAVEVILESIRGMSERLGVAGLRGKVTLDEALKLAGEFAPTSTDLNTKIQAVKAAAEQLKGKATDNLRQLQEIKEKLIAAGANTDILAGELNAVAAVVKNDLEQDESRRIFLLRLIAAVVGCFLAYQTNFYVFQILSQAPESKELLAGLTRLNQEWINVLVGGLAAAAGSSYWHDKLDKIRNLKSAVQQAKTLGT